MRRPDRFFRSWASVRHAGKRCQSIRGRGIDEAIGALLLETVSPVACEVALAVQKEIIGRIRKADQMREAQLVRARYEYELARRRYIKVDPDNRLVADTLEAEWNEQLRLLDEIQQVSDRQRAADKIILTDDVRKQIMELTRHFSRVWNDPSTKAIDKKRIVALLIEDVTLTKADDNAVHIQFRGGKIHRACKKITSHSRCPLIPSGGVA